MRFVVKHPTLGYLAHHDIVGAANSIEADGTGTKHLHQRHVLKPVFHADWRQACKYETNQDAVNAMAVPHVSQEGRTAGPFIADSNAFEGCTVETVPYFNG